MFTFLHAIYINSTGETKTTDEYSIISVDMSDLKKNIYLIPFCPGCLDSNAWTEH